MVAFSVALVICAIPFQPVALPTVEHVDTEVTTNITITAWQSRVAKFTFSLSCLSTPSNNVEVAFGTDADADGVLDPGETEMVVGWDCGSWFVRKGIDGHRVEAASSSTNEIKTLAWKYRLTASTIGLDGQFGTQIRQELSHCGWNSMCIR